MQENSKNMTFIIFVLILFLGVPLIVYMANMNNSKEEINNNFDTEIIVKDDIEKIEDIKLDELDKNEESGDNVKMTLDKKLSTPRPEMQIDANKSYTAILKTDAGDITINLNAKDTPITVNNFVALSRMGFYDEVIFHRVIKDFMIQSGDPMGNGMGGPDYKFDDEKFKGDYTRGTIAMANAGPNTNGSQFFIVHKDTPLPKLYVIFGNVTEGLDVVDKIATSPVKVSPMGEASTPVTPVKITGVEIIEK